MRTFGACGVQIDGRSVDCAQPFYLAYAKENAKKSECEALEWGGPGWVCERSEQEDLERL